MSNLHTVYKLTFPNGKMYFGITVDYKSRMRAHSYCERRISYHSPIKCAIKKYGWSCVKQDIIAEKLTPEEAYAMEISLIKEYNTQDIDNGYNLANGGRTALGCKHSTNKAKGRPLSESHKLALIQAKKGKDYSKIAGKNSTKYPVVAIDIKTGISKIFENASVFGRENGIRIYSVYQHILRNSRLLQKQWNVRYIQA